MIKVDIAALVSRTFALVTAPFMYLTSTFHSSSTKWTSCHSTQRETQALRGCPRERPSGYTVARPISAEQKAGGTTVPSPGALPPSPWFCATLNCGLFCCLSVPGKKLKTVALCALSARGSGSHRREFPKLPRPPGWSGVKTDFHASQ